MELLLFLTKPLSMLASASESRVGLCVFNTLPWNFFFKMFVKKGWIQKNSANYSIFEKCIMSHNPKQLDRMDIGVLIKIMMVTNQLLTVVKLGVLEPFLWSDTFWANHIPSHMCHWHLCDNCGHQSPVTKAGIIKEEGSSQQSLSESYLQEGLLVQWWKDLAPLELPEGEWTDRINYRYTLIINAEEISNYCYKLYEKRQCASCRKLVPGWIKNYHY